MFCYQIHFDPESTKAQQIKIVLDKQGILKRRSSDKRFKSFFSKGHLPYTRNVAHKNIGNYFKSIYKTANGKSNV